MFLACLWFGLPTLHGEDVRCQGLHLHHVIVIEFSALSGFVVHPVKNDVCMVIRLEPFFPDLETFLVLCIRLSVHPMPFIFVQEELKRSDAPTSLAFLAKFLHVCQCGVWFDEQHTLTDGWASCHFDNLAVLSFAFTLFLLHGTTCLFLYHPFDVVVVRLQVGVAEVPVYPLIVVSGEFRHDVDFGCTDITHILGSPSVMSLAWLGVARLDMYAWFCCHFLRI